MSIKQRKPYQTTEDETLEYEILDEEEQDEIINKITKDDDSTNSQFKILLSLSVVLLFSGSLYNNRSVFDGIFYTLASILGLLKLWAEGEGWDFKKSTIVLLFSIFPTFNCLLRGDEKYVWAFMPFVQTVLITLGDEAIRSADKEILELKKAKYSIKGA